MSEPVQNDSSRSPARASWQLRMLVLVLFLEALALAGITVVLVLEILRGASQDLVSAVALTLVSAILTAGMGAVVIGAARAQPWIRGAATTVQILVIAVAIGSFQGVFARVDIGWLLLAPATVALALLFSRPVVAATKRTER